MWQGLQTITGYKTKPPTHSNCDSVATPDNLNTFYSRFDKLNNTPTATFLTSNLTPPFTIQNHEVVASFQKQNSKKAPGPDGILTATLIHCADLLAPVFTDIFNFSLETQTVPSCFKSSIIVPVPKKQKVMSLNEYRPVALTSVLMKIFERFILKFLKPIVGPILDPYQFAYRENRCVEDAVSLTLHSILQHLDKDKTYARILFVDFSSAFNTIIPMKLYEKLISMSISTSLCRWVLDFLLNRPQSVRFENQLSDVIVLNTGAPQGCVLSPLLFSLFTNDCVSHHESVCLAKFADDTTVAGLIKNSDESEYRREISNLVTWCHNNNLELNSSKTKEIVVDFRRKQTPIEPISIDGDDIERVECFKFLGTIICNDLKWHKNTEAIVKKARQRLYFLRQLKKFNLNSEILVQFYRATIESVLCFSITVWFGSLTHDQIHSLNNIVKTASKIIGTELPSLWEIDQKRVKTRVQKIIEDETHPANHLFELMPSKARFRHFRINTDRFGNSLFPRAVRIMDPSVIENNGITESDSELKQLSEVETGSDENVIDTCPERVIVPDPTPISSLRTNPGVDPAPAPILRRSARILGRTLKPMPEPEHVHEPILDPQRNSDSILVHSTRSSARLRARRKQNVI